jgi:hypothetical protein
MRVSLSTDALVDEAAWVHLDQIIYEIENGRHKWHIDDLETVEQSRWLKGGRPSIRTLFEKAAMLPSPRVAKKVHRMLLTVGKDLPPSSLSASKAVQFLRTPLTVLMENRFTDGSFLDAVLSVLADPEVMRLKEDLSALVYDGPGGNGELKKLVEDFHAKGQRSEVPLRAVVFTDSDGRRAGAKSDQAKAVEEACNRLGIPCVVLRKRSIESYVPDEVIREWQDEPAQTAARSRIAALLRLSGEQRDHFPIKKGLRNTPEEIDLYKSGTQQPPLSLAEEAELQRGFGDEFIYILFLKNANGDFEKTSSGARRLRPSLTAEAMRKRDGCGELDQLVAYIEDRL